MFLIFVLILNILTRKTFRFHGWIINISILPGKQGVMSAGTAHGHCTPYEAVKKETIRILIHTYIVLPHNDLLPNSVHSFICQAFTLVKYMQYCGLANW